jgi:CspA family cold shock protein
METGTVKWFNIRQGFGFIARDRGGEDVYAHYSEIEQDGWRCLRVGERVMFVVRHGPKGAQAHAIRIVSEIPAYDNPDAGLAKQGGVRHAR